MDDAALVEAARSGDQGALAAIYDRYADRLHDFCFSILRDRDEAADAFHDAFLLAAGRLDQLRDPSRLRPWLYAIARNESLRRARARSRLVPTEEVGDVSAIGPGPVESVEQEELREVVWAAAEGLSARDRALLDLNLRQGLDGQELALAAGVSPSNVYVLLSRLRQQVERSLGALLVARLGRKDCDDLATLLRDWDGRFSPLVRKRVARHVDRCDVCADRRRNLVSPLSLFAAVPPLAAPAALRERVLGDIEQVAHGSGPDDPGPRFDRDGFPRPDRRRRTGVISGAIAAALVVAVAAVLATGSLTSTTDDQTVAAGGGPTTSTSEPGPSSPSEAPVAEAPLGSAPPQPGSPGMLGTTVSKPPLLPTITTTTTPSAPDTLGPVITGLVAEPSEISEQAAGASCSRPTTSMVSVQVADPSGVRSVSLRWSVGTTASQEPMAASGATWTADLGPFGTATLSRDGRISVVVSATDGAGNSSEAKTFLTLYDCSGSIRAPD